MVPIRVRYKGNKSTGPRLIGLGKKILSKLEYSMQHRSLPTGYDRLKLSDGSIIRVNVNYGIREIEIRRPFNVGEYKPAGECQCGKFFAEGVVVGIIPVPGYETPAQLYTVDVCQGNNTQITVSNCVAHDFREYAVGERVWCSLDIREAIPSYPFWNYYPEYAQDFAFSTPWGAVGEERKFSYVSCADTNGNYNKGAPPLSVSVNALDPCGNSRGLPDTEWPGEYQRMCSLTPDITTCFWMFKSLTNYFVKDEKSLYSEYSMLTTVGGTIDPLKDYSIRWLFNLQIMPI